MSQDRPDQGRPGQGGQCWARWSRVGLLEVSVPDGSHDGQWLAYQSIEVISQQGPVMIDLPLQDDEQEEQTKQNVPQVAEDVVEGARRDETGLPEPAALTSVLLPFFCPPGFTKPHPAYSTHPWASSTVPT